MCTFDFYPELMTKPMKKFFWTLGILVSLIILLSLGFVVFLTVTEFSPVSKSKVEVGGNAPSIDPERREFSLLTWNVGYAGLGKELDFFYDGGKKTRPGKSQCLDYFNGIKKVVKSYDTVDFMLIQEVDVNSKRSWKQNEYDSLCSQLPGYCHGFAYNYKSRFIPVPLMAPMGHVNAGLVTFSAFRPDDAVVQYFESDFPWPTRLAMLKRCYILFRFRLNDGKDLVIINLHNSAYDSTGLLRERELSILDSVLQYEYSRGNYVIAGGDWNSNPRGFHPNTFRQGDLSVLIEPPIPDTFASGWNFVFDSLVPSNRFTDMPYQKGLTRTTIIDFFVVSPNIEIKYIATQHGGFEYSDHEPVILSVKLK
jgi:endonuclease/exonuclease/phosphatase family metal-dependent hydrolase